MAIWSNSKPGGLGPSVVYLVNLDLRERVVLFDCFQQFGIETRAAFTRTGNPLKTRTFAGCVVRLDDPAATVIIAAAQTSQLKSRLVAYGICRTPQELAQALALGLMVLQAPLEAEAVSEMIRSTYPLLAYQDPERHAIEPDAGPATAGGAGGFSFFNRMDALVSAALSTGNPRDEQPDHPTRKTKHAA